MIKGEIFLNRKAIKKAILMTTFFSLSLSIFFFIFYSHFLNSYLENKFQRETESKKLSVFLLNKDMSQGEVFRIEDIREERVEESFLKSIENVIETKKEEIVGKVAISDIEKDRLVYKDLLLDEDEYFKIQQELDYRLVAMNIGIQDRIGGILKIGDLVDLNISTMDKDGGVSYETFLPEMKIEDIRDEKGLRVEGGGGNRYVVFKLTPNELNIYSNTINSSERNKSSKIFLTLIPQEVAQLQRNENKKLKGEQLSVNQNQVIEEMEKGETKEREDNHAMEQLQEEW
jgi:hypothetical protein